MKRQIGTAALLSTFLIGTALAGSPTSKPGWEKPTLFGRSEAGPAIADIDGDGKQDVIIAAQSKVYVLKYDGSDLVGWPVSLGSQTSYTPAVGDVDGDGSPEVVIGGDKFSKIYIFKSNGQALAGWPKDIPSTSVSLADMDNDGKLDIIAPNVSYVNIVRYDGTSVSGWPKYFTFGITPQVAVGDVDRDTNLDVVINESAEKAVYVFTGYDGSRHTGTPFELPDTMEPIWAKSPVLGDIDGDGRPEIVIAGEIGDTETRIYALKDGGALVWKYEGLPGSTIQPVLADIDKDGVPDVVFRSGGHLFQTTEEADVYAIKSDGTLLLGPVHITNAFDGENKPPPEPLVSDIDKDGYSEILLPSIEVSQDEWGTTVLKHDGTVMSGWPMVTPLGSPVVGDLENDRNTDVIISSLLGYPMQGTYAWTMGANTYGKREWPMLRHDAQRTANYHTQLPTAIREKTPKVPQKYQLSQNYPNPFNSTTSVEFELPRTGEVNLAVYNVLGQKVRTLESGKFQAGNYRSAWNGKMESGKDAPSGVYLLNMKVGDYSATKKMLFVK